MADDFVGQLWSLDTINLSQFDRMAAIGRAFRWFRINKVEVRFKPYADTYAAYGSQSVPYLYTLVDTGDVMNLNSFNAIRDAGAKPRRFDDKTCLVSYKPRVLMFGGKQTQSGDPVTTSITPVYNSSKQSPWLPTNVNAGLNATTWAPNTTSHLGLIYGVEQDTTGAGVRQAYGVELTVYFEFKGPLNAPGTQSETVPIAVKEIVASEEGPRVIDNSGNIIVSK